MNDGGQKNTSAFYQHAITMTTSTHRIDLAGLQLPTLQYSVQFTLIYTVSVTIKIVSAEAQSLQEWQEKLPCHRKKPGAEPGSYERALLLMSREGGGETGRERRPKGGEGQIGQTKI